MVPVPYIASVNMPLRPIFKLRYDLKVPRKQKKDWNIMQLITNQTSFGGERSFTS